LPGEFNPVTGEGVTVCMHLRGVQNTTSSIVADLANDPERPLRAWVAPGQPCVTPFVPVWPPEDVPAWPGEAAVWRRFEGLRNRAEADGEYLLGLRETVAVLERELWAEADGAGDAAGRRAFGEAAWRRVSAIWSA
jgi:hypothetical protein